MATTTSAKNRLGKLLEGKTKPTPADPSKPHFADTELQSIVVQEQQDALPQATNAVVEMSQSQDHFEQYTSSDDNDDYISAFKKKPMMQPPKKVNRRTEPGPGAMPEANAFGHPKDSHIESFLPLKSFPKVRVSENTVYNNRSDIESPSETGELPAKDSEGNQATGHFCALKLVSRLPYKYMVDGNDRVSRHFFAQNKFWNREWDINIQALLLHEVWSRCGASPRTAQLAVKFNVSETAANHGRFTSSYYVHPPSSVYTNPILLLPFKQVKDLVDDIGRTFKVEMAVPADPFTLSFFDDGTPQPQFLGTSKCKDDATELQASIPAASQSQGEAPSKASPALDRSFKAFKEKILRVQEASKKTKNALKKKKANDRLLNVRSYVSQLKRTQRYFGLRPRTTNPIDPDLNLSWAEQEDYQKDQLKKGQIFLDPLDVKKVVPYAFEHETVMICIDVEAYERNHNVITEIGISTLDTLDLIDLPPGDRGENWKAQIRSRHFRIKEHEFYRNTDFCPGNPDGFGFGTSEVISRSEIVEVVDSCFEYPFSAGFNHPGDLKPSEEAANGEDIAENHGSAPSWSRTVAERIFSIDGIDARGPTNADHSAANKAVALALLGSSAEVASVISDENPALNEPQPNTTIPSPTNQQNRRLLVVGHNIEADLDYLKTLGSKIFSPSRATYPIPATEMMIDGSGNTLPSGSTAASGNAYDQKGKSHILASIIEALDTAILFRVLKKEANNRSLANMIADLDICGWNLHNAGNDARYTLEALVSLVIKARIADDEARAMKEAQADCLVRTENGKTEWEMEKERRIEEKVWAARQDAVEECEAWEKLGAAGTNRACSISPLPGLKAVSGVNTKGVFATALPILKKHEETNILGTANDKEEQAAQEKMVKLEAGAKNDPWEVAGLNETPHKQYGTDEMIQAESDLQNAQIDDGGSPQISFLQLLANSEVKKQAKKTSKEKSMERYRALSAIKKEIESKQELPAPGGW